MAGFAQFTGQLADSYYLQSAINAYVDEAYTNARKLSGSGIVGDNPMIDQNTESFVGQMRWFKPLSANINVASLTNAAGGTTTQATSEYLKYIKTLRTFGSTKINMQQLVTQQDGLAKIARDFAEVRAQDEHNALLSILRGVMYSELLAGAAAAAGGTGLGGQTWSNDPKDKKCGFYVDLGAKGLLSLNGKDSGGTANAAYQGAARAEAFLEAFGIGFKDYEPPSAYLVTSPEVMASLRTANLVDQTKVTEGNMDFDSIFQGKFKLIQTRATSALSTTEVTRLNDGAGPNLTSASYKVSFLVVPGAIAMRPLAVPDPVEITRNGAAYNGGGETNIWYRWGYVMAPAGYDWNGLETVFPDDNAYRYVRETATWKELATITATTGAANTVGAWARKADSALSLGILPILHQ
jgi:hypothetical protein